MGGVAREAKTFRGGGPLTPPPTVPFFPLNRGCRGLSGRSFILREDLAPSSKPRALAWGSVAQRSIFSSHTKAPPGLVVLAPVSLLLRCLKQNFAKCDSASTAPPPL